MPIERELKFVLNHSSSLMTDLRDAAAAENAPVSGTVCAYGIDQGYLQKGSRVRELSPVYLGGIPSGVAKPHYRFTYKQKLSNQPGDLEIECELTKADFDLAWAEAERKLYKVRVVLPRGNFKFEVDHFYESRDHFLDGEPPYLVLAEVELPNQGTQFAYSPEDLPLHPIIEKHLLAAVPEGDNRFSNRKLGDTEYVAKVLREVTSAQA
jgi:CYTH domain-containing protein